MADNLAALMQVAPTFGAFGIGQQMASNRETEAVNRQNTLQDVLMKQQEYGFNEQNNPLRLEKGRLSNTGLDLENQGKVLANRKTSATLDSDIAATNSGNQLKVLGDHIKAAEEHERKFGEWAQGIQQVPPAMRGQWLSQQMAANGMDPSNPQIQQFAQAAAQNPQLLVQSVQKIRQSRAEMTPAYIQALAVAKEHSRSATNVANIHAASAKEVAGINANSREAVAKARANAKASVEKMVPALERQPAAFTLMGRQAEQNGNTEEALFWYDEARKAEALLMNKANAKGTATVEDGKVKTEHPDPVYDRSKAKLGTAENPIKLDD